MSLYVCGLIVGPSLSIFRPSLTNSETAPGVQDFLCHSGRIQFCPRKRTDRGRGAEKTQKKTDFLQLGNPRQTSPHACGRQLFSFFTKTHYNHTFTKNLPWNVTNCSWKNMKKEQFQIESKQKIWSWNKLMMFISSSIWHEHKRESEIVKLFIENRFVKMKIPFCWMHKTNSKG